LYSFTYAGIQHDYHIILVALNGHTTCASSETGRGYHSEVPEFTPVLCIVFCRPMLVFLPFFDYCIVCPSSDYGF